MINWMGGGPREGWLAGTEWDERWGRAWASVGAGVGDGDGAGGGRRGASDPEAEGRLRRALSETTLRAPAGADPARIRLAAGADAALSSLLRRLTSPGDTVLVHQPISRTALRAMGRLGLRVRAVACDGEGMRPDALFRELTERRPALVYAAPLCADPTGLNWSLERRVELARLCAWARVPLVRDDRQAMLRFDPAVPAPGEAEGEAACHSVGQWPPGLLPGLRLGWAVEATPSASASRAGPDDGASVLGAWPGEAAHTLCDLLVSSAYEASLERIRSACRSRLRTLAAELARTFGPRCEAVSPAGGMHLWLRLPAGLDGEALLRGAWLHGLLFQPGRPFYAGDPVRHTIRLTPACTPEDRISEGVRRLAGAAADFLGRLAEDD